MTSTAADKKARRTAPGQRWWSSALVLLTGVAASGLCVPRAIGAGSRATLTERLAGTASLSGQMTRRFGEISTPTPEGTPEFALPGESPFYALVRVTVAAAAEAQTHSLMTRLNVEGFSAQCAGTPLTLGYGFDERAVTSAQGDPPVLIAQKLLCLPVSRANAPQTLLGLKLSGRAVTQDPGVGANYLSPDPAAFEARGASLFVPGIKGGYLVSAFAVGGDLETQDGLGVPFPTVFIAMEAEWVSGPVMRSHYFASVETPGGTPLGDALTVRVGPPKAGEPPPRLYQDDYWGFSDGDSASDAP